jgi:hypothetical protein
MSSTLSFSLRVSSGVKTVHLLGSWDNYTGQLPLSKDKTSSKSGSWKGTFRFQPTTVEAGQRYWYYYIIDGYHVSHDPAKDHTTEPTTGRKLNIIDIPSKTATAPAKSSRESRRASQNIPKGRGVSPSRIVAPKPQRPGETRQVINTQYNQTTLEELNRRFARQDINSDSEDDSDSDADSDVPSLTSSRSSGSSSPSSVSSGSSCCTCERYGITRKGDRVKLDCGGARCSFSDESDECSSEDEYVYEQKQTRRNGVIIRN